MPEKKVVSLKLFKHVARIESEKNSFSHWFVNTRNNLSENVVNSFKTRLNKCLVPLKFSTATYQ